MSEVLLIASSGVEGIVQRVLGMGYGGVEVMGAGGGCLKRDDKKNEGSIKKNNESGGGGEGVLGRRLDAQSSGEPGGRRREEESQPHSSTDRCIWDHQNLILLEMKYEDM